MKNFTRLFSLNAESVKGNLNATKSVDIWFLLKYSKNIFLTKRYYFSRLAMLAMVLFGWNTNTSAQLIVNATTGNTFGSIAVPAGCTRVTLDVAGGHGSTKSGANGGGGGEAKADFTVTPLENLFYYVGASVPNSTQAGGLSGGGGEDGGTGITGNFGGGGGAGSDVRTSVSDASTRLIAGGGGGGGAFPCVQVDGGNGGNPTGNGAAGGCGFSGATGATTAGPGNPGNDGGSAGSLTGAGGNGGVKWAGGGGGGWYGGGGGAESSGGGGLSLAVGFIPTTVAYTTGNITTTDGFVKICAWPTITTQPTVSSNVCPGGALSLTIAASDAGATYQWYSNASNSNVVAGSTSLGSANGAQTATYTGASSAGAGTTTYYFCVATNVCGSLNSNTGQVIVATPPATETVTGTTSICVGSGTPIGLNASQANVQYQVGNASGSIIATVTPGATAGVNLVASEGTAGTYTVTASNTSGLACPTLMSGSAIISVNNFPTVEAVTGTANICNGSGTPIGLNASQAGIQYQVGNASGPIGAPVAPGSTSGVSLITSETSAGTYTVSASNTSGAACPILMSGSATVTVTALPTLETVTGTTNICTGSGTPIGLNASQANVQYLVGNAAGTIVATVTPGASSGVNLVASEGTAGTYTVLASNVSGPACPTLMSGSAIIGVNNFPTVETVTGTANICSGSTTPVGLNATQSNVQYQIGNASGPIGAPITPGSTAGYNLIPAEATAGTYTVTASNTSGAACPILMSGSAVITTTNLPTIETVTGTMNICSGSGTPIGLNASQANVQYQVGNAAGTIVATLIPGATGGVNLIAAESTAGTYTVVATNATGLACPTLMSGSATVTVTALPTVETVTGGGSYCAGGAGFPIGLSASQAGVQYQLKNGSGVLITSSTPGAGGAFNIINPEATAGTYTVLASYTSAPACPTLMSGSTTIAVTSTPTVYTLSGGGGFCSGGPGVPLILSLSDNGVAYQLYGGGLPIGSLVIGNGSGINFGPQTALGTYSVIANPGAGPGCATMMNGNPTVNVNSAPAPIGGTPNVCVGLTTTLTDITGAGTWTSSNSSVATVDISTGVVYGAGTGTTNIQFTLTSTGCTTTISVTSSAVPMPIVGGNKTLCVGSSITLSDGVSGGTWSSSNSSEATIDVSSGVLGAVGPGPLVITYNEGPGCSAVTTVTVNALPTVASIATSPSSPLCTGAVLTLTAGAVSGTGTLTSYNWTGPNGYGAAGASNSTTLTAATIAASGNYSVSVTYSGIGCTSTRAATLFPVTVNTAPSLTSASNSGPVCAGNSLSLSANGPGGSPTYSWAGPAVITNPTSQTPTVASPVSGIYTVTVTNGVGSGCTLMYTTTAIVNAVPATPTVLGGSATPVCGSTTLTASNGNDGTIYFEGTVFGASLTTTPAVLEVVSGVGTNTYYFRAQSPGGCWSAPAGATVTINPAPFAGFTMTGGGAYCPGGTGVNVGLNGSEAGVSYQLYDGVFSSGSPVFGTGGIIGFGLRTGTGNYTAIATNTVTACTSTITSGTSITVSPAPSPFTVIGGGSYCLGGTGVHIGLNGSDAGVTYQLYSGGLPVGSLVTGGGAAIDFGLQTATGTYSVIADPAATCALTMTGGATVLTTTLPTTYTVTGSGSYCPGTSGLHVGLSGSQTSTNYQLYNNGVIAGPVTPGTGAPLDFGLEAAGTYTVVATNTSTTCVNNMTSSAIVATAATPSVVAVTGGGSYCLGGTGVHIGTATSTSGINYQLFNGLGAASPITGGTGGALDFGLQTTAGTYTVIATNAAFCTAVMSGNPTVTIGGSTPALHTVVGGGTECAGGLGFDIGINGSDVGVSYQLYLGSTPVGTLVSGTGAALDLGLQTAAGTYSVVADPGTTCATPMTGSTSINMTTAPTAYVVTGGGTYCAGGSGFDITLNGSDIGTSYQLTRDGLAVGPAIPGNTGSLDFGTQTSGGTYKVVATSGATHCSATMTDSAVIVMHPIAIMHTLSGGGTFCANGVGVDIALSGSEVGVAYQLYIGSTPIDTIFHGTGLPLDFGLQTTAGQYAAVANPASACATTMTNSVVVTVNPIPTIYNVTGAGSYCAGSGGVHVGLSGSTSGISYQLYDGNTVEGTPMIGGGSPLDFGLETTAGAYSVVATNTGTGCKDTTSNPAVITINTLPNVYTVTGGSGYCAGGAGVHIGLSGSTTGVNYQLMNGVVPIGIAIGGTGSTLDFGSITLAGTYWVQATNPGTLCTNNMSGTAVVTMNPLPIVYNVSGGGNYCAGGAGQVITVSNSQVGVNYQPYNGTGAIGTPVAGTGTLLSLGSQTAAGTYTVIATTTGTGCQSTMSLTATVTINPLPLIQSVTGGGAYCANNPGVHIGVSASQAGITYSLYRGNTFVTSGTGAGPAIDFGLETIAGTYSVVAATSGTLTCSSNMSGSVDVSINPLPTAYTVTGTGSYCSGGVGLHVLLSGSASGNTYQLYRNGSTIGTPMAGLVSGLGLDFGLQRTAGTYTIVATNSGTGCSAQMTSSATITINPAPFLHTVTGGGHYCTGGVGVHIGLDNSFSGISYQLYNGLAAVGSPTVSIGGPLDFGLQTAAGTYSVIATNSFSCSTTMSGNAVVVVDPLPLIFPVGGGGTYCAGGTGFHITLGGSTLGVNYQLYYNGSMINAPVGGTGSLLDMGLEMASGSYSVVATVASGTGCTNNMSGSATIVANPLPTVYSVTGGGAYCSGGAGVHVGVSNSNLGINYQLLNNGAPVTTVGGTTHAIDFGLQTAGGLYTVVETNSVTTCPVGASGSASVTINPLPLVYTVSGTGSYCAGGTGVDVTITNSDNGINYQLYRGSALVGSPMPGTTLSQVDFGLQTVAGTYTVSASDAVTGCTSNMAGSATISINPQPTRFSISGGGGYCQGGTGVHIGLSSSAVGIRYDLYSSTSPSALASLAGTAGGALDFGLFTAAGTYSVVATNTTGTGCTDTMSGVATVIVNLPPAVHHVFGGGTRCSNEPGVDVRMFRSQAGISYQLYNGATAVGTPTVSPGGFLNFGLQSAAGTYSVLATNLSTTCTSGMADVVTVSVTPAPTIYTMTGGGSYCFPASTGVHIGLSNSATGVSYELYQNGTDMGPFAGVNGPLDFGIQAAGTYTVVATGVGSCMSNMSGNATVIQNAQPNEYVLFGSSSSYCLGGIGVDLQMTNSDVGTNYQLFDGSAPIGFLYAGTGHPIDFGLQTARGTYIVQATVAATTCSMIFSSTASIAINPLPDIFSVTGGGGYCAGTSGAHIGLSHSVTGVDYSLYRHDTLIGTLSGTGSALDFGAFTTVGTYTVSAASVSTHCPNDMAGSATISINPLPSVYTITGGGNYCIGTAGVHDSLSGSTVGINYQLYFGSAPVGFPVAGTGSAIDFGLQSSLGTYTVLAIDSHTGCSRNMPGIVSVGQYALPAVYTVTGGGDYCQGGIGVGITLQNSATGVSYQLFNGTTPLITLPGTTGAAINFGLQMTAGTYTVVGTSNSTHCAVNMSGSAVVVVDPLPTVFNVTGGGSYCAGGAGLHVTLSGSQTNVNYQLYKGNVSTGFTVAGTGSALDLGTQFDTGTYTIIATNDTTGCIKTMSGSTHISINPLLVPSVTLSTGAGDSVCFGNSVTLTALTGNSGTAPTFQWQVNGFTIGATTGSYIYVPTNGDVVTVTMTSNAICATPATVSNSITLAVLPNGSTSVSIAANPGNTVCVGTLVTYSATPTFGGTNPVYTWIKNGVPVPGVTGDSYSYVPAGADIIFCMIVGNYPCSSADTAFSNTITMATDVPLLPSVAISADPGTGVGPGTSVTLTAVVTNAGINPLYQWYVNRQLVRGATFSTFTSNSFTDLDSVTVVVTSSNSCALSAFNSVIIHVWPLGVVQVSPGAGDIKLIPNPNKGEFMIKGTLGTTVDQEVSLEITNMLGQVVYRNKVMAHNGDINEHVQLSNTLANGMYILNLHADGGETKVFHIVVEQ